MRAREVSLTVIALSMIVVLCVTGLRGRQHSREMEREMNGVISSLEVYVLRAREDGARIKAMIADVRRLSERVEVLTEQNRQACLALTRQVKLTESARDQVQRLLLEQARGGK